jgi:hypothetical protein
MNSSKGLQMTNEIEVTSRQTKGIRGCPFQPGNKFGRGRPKGSPNKKTLHAQKIFDENAAAIMALAINHSREDRQMLRMLASRILPRHRDLPVKVGRLCMKTVADLDRASEVILRQATSGKISLAEALDMSAMIENRRRVLETQDLDRRLRAVEDADLTRGR